MNIEFPNGKYTVKLGYIPAGSYELPKQKEEMVKRIETLLEFVTEFVDETGPIPIQIECVVSGE